MIIDFCLFNCPLICQNMRIVYCLIHTLSSKLFLIFYDRNYHLKYINHKIVLPLRPLITVQRMSSSLKLFTPFFLTESAIIFCLVFSLRTSTLHKQVSDSQHVSAKFKVFWIFQVITALKNIYNMLFRLLNWYLFRSTIKVQTRYCYFNQPPIFGVLGVEW